MKGDFRVKTWLSCSFLVSQWGQNMVGVPKGLSHLIFIKPPHLNMLKLSNTFILKVLIYSLIDTLKRYCSVHRMSILNKFQDSYKVLEKNLELCLMEKRSLAIDKKCLNNFFWPKIFTTNTLCVDVYKMYI
jgi:hypothetical protein